MSAPAPGALWRVIRVVTARPELWPVALVVAWHLTPRHWWRRWPPLPVPDAAYWRFRMTTAYGGDGDARVDPADVIEFLYWCRARSRRVRRVLR